MPNAFYQSFDTQVFGERTDDYRSPFQRDRDRLIHTSAFRRLQAKTQVFLAGEYDFYRTRLTHSIEVAQIGRSICTYLLQHSDLLDEGFCIDSDLVEVICLAHDLGHPPFGHAGESSLNRLLAPWGGFEGNAQTLRIICDTVYGSGTKRAGLSPSRAFMDGVLKYKTLYGESDDKTHHFIYDQHAEHRTFVFDGAALPAALTPGKKLNQFRSIECQIMDWADDTAYSTNDLADSINAGFLSIDGIERWAAEQDLSDDNQSSIEAILDSIRTEKVESFFGRRIARFVQAVSLTERENFMSATTNRYRFDLVIDPTISAERNLFKKLAVDLVFRSPQISQLEHKGDMMLTRIFEALQDNYLGENPARRTLLPRKMEAALAEEISEAERARLIGDYLSGMTDGYALRTYQRMFEPRFGSIVDLVQ